MSFIPLIFRLVYHVSSMTVESCKCASKVSPKPLIERLQKLFFKLRENIAHENLLESGKFLYRNEEQVPLHVFLRLKSLTSHQVAQERYPKFCNPQMISFLTTNP